MAEQFGVSEGWAKKIYATRTRTGQIERPPWRHGPVSRVTVSLQQWIGEQIRKQPDLTLLDLQEQLQEVQGVGLSIGRLWLALRGMGLRLKKVTPRPGTRNRGIAAAPASVARNAEPDQPAAVGVSGERAVAQMTRNYSRAARGERVPEGTPNSPWHTLTMLAVLTSKSLQAPMTIESPTDGDVFLAYLEQVLCPQLPPGQVVIMDNLAAHKVAGVRQLIEASGARLLYLPPSSPDFNPIEQAWSKIKQAPPSAQTRTVDALENAIKEALAAITAENASAWSPHCGYGLQ